MAKSIVLNMENHMTQDNSMLPNGYGSKVDSQEMMRDNSDLNFIIIGAGARGNAYAEAVTQSIKGRVVAVAEPIAFKRNALGRKYIWGQGHPSQDQAFEDWKEFIRYERHRKQKREKGEPMAAGVDGVFICTLDEMHAEIITALASLDLHIMCEKPLATTLSDCLKIYRSLHPIGTESPEKVFSIGHVLHYSPHNMLLRKLLLEDDVIGEILSMEHTEPIGWWHFAHSYVRGNWRKESTTAPSLLTKSCHDIDLLLWLLCSPRPASNTPPHLPTNVTSTGSLIYFKKSRKPALAGDATNCLSCPAERECIYSAKKIYEENHLAKGDAKWPVHIVDSEIEDIMNNGHKDAAIRRLRERLAADYDKHTPQAEIDRRPWFGRCVYESNNDVCDDQVVTITWEDDPLPADHQRDMATRLKSRGAKTATFHMIAFTEKRCERRGRVYGSKGEIEYDSTTIKVHDFATEQTQTHHPHQRGGGHGGGDAGLAEQYIEAVDAVKYRGMSVQEAQRMHVGCTLEEVIRSHALVFAAEEARKKRKVVDWAQWWHLNVEADAA